MLGIVYCCTSPDAGNLALSEEHSEHRWVSAYEARELLGGDHSSESWLLRVIDRAEIMRRHYPDILTTLHQLEGFELDS